MSLKELSLLVVLVLAGITGSGQVVTECPRNIGFESGSLLNWKCYTGEISGTGRNFPNIQRPAVISIYPSNPVNGVHTLIKRGAGTDFYGGFSLDSPNGSEYVIRLGNKEFDRGAERISYLIDVPLNAEEYSVVFNYAVVLENPDHQLDEQPKFTAKVIDVATETFTECGSFEFTAPGAGSGIPGFDNSPLNDSVLYKSWSPVMVNLSNYRGRTIRLEFTTNDCSRGRHFGYAYIDFNENCSIPVSGNIVCEETEQITLKVIPGLAEYRWFNADSGEPLGNQSEVTLAPAPAAGTKIGVELVPYDGLGCRQVLYTTVTSMFMKVSNPPERCTSVDVTATSVTVGNSSDLTYTYWRDAECTTALPNPNKVNSDGTYYIKGQSTTGCTMVAPVLVTLTKLKPINITQPGVVSFPSSVDITACYTSEPGISYSFWTDPLNSIPLQNPKAVRRPGIYYIRGSNAEGCFSTAQVTVSMLMPDFFIPNTFTPNGDGLNDVFTVIAGPAFRIKSFKIFNRWGDIVYQTTDITRYWDGLHSNSKVPAGVYYWLLEGDESLTPFKRSGYVTVLR